MASERNEDDPRHFVKMEETRISRLSRLFDEALSLAPIERAEFLKAQRLNDAELGDELIALVDAHASSSTFFEKLSGDVIAPVYDAIANTSQDRSVLLSALQNELKDSYRIEGELTGGAMSRVFVAEDIKLRRKVVLKVLPPEMLQSVNADRFRREIQFVAQLQHSHIVPLLTTDSVGSVLYYTMPFVAGESLRTRIARDGALTSSNAIRIWCDILDALAYAHGHGVIHRDIKPANILLTERNALVTDFGIARAFEAASEDAQSTATGLVIGTPAYMAPEQISGDAPVDQRVDIYAAGLVMYEMIEGHSPFQARSTRELVLAHLTRDPQPITRQDCPPEVAVLIMQCLAKNPGDRPASAEQVLSSIDQTSTRGSGDYARTSVAASKPPFSRRISPFRRTIPYAIAGMAILAAVIGFAKFRGKNVAPAANGAESLAVMPLVNLSRDPLDAGVADGMTEELIATLSRNSNLRVAGSTSAFAFRDHKSTAHQIADSLGVTSLLEGSIQKIGTRLRIQVRLVNGSDGSTRWSETYDRNFEDVFAVQDDIARSVSSELSARLDARARNNAPTRRYRPNIAAYEWYLRGMDVTLLRSDSGQLKGLEYFNRAIALDSSFAAAYAGLTRMYLQMGTRSREQNDLVGRGLAAALKAVSLDSSSAEAYVGLGWAELANGKNLKAEQDFKRAMTLDAHAPRLHEGLARVYLNLDRPADELIEARAGVADDPFSYSAIRELALALNISGRCDESLKLLAPLKALSPPAAVSGIIRGMCYAQKQMWAEAISEFQWAGKFQASAAPAFLGFSYARSGNLPEARKILADLLANKKYSRGAFGIAIIYTGLRDYDQAFEWLEKAAKAHQLGAYIMDPIFADLHRDPRFEHLKLELRT
ncbi:MAG TPA: protein kinase [Gemmatimonadaceae bacterium]|nr:protein kinase [Gemmatimonadaceae bacterium]